MTLLIIEGEMTRTYYSSRHESRIISLLYLPSIIMISTNTQIVVCNFQIILIETFTRKNIYEIHRKNIYECNFVRFNPSKWFKNYTFKEYL